MKISSLPPRPLGREEADLLVQQTGGKFVPDTYIEALESPGGGFIAATFHREDGELLLGFSREEGEWTIIGKQPPTAPLTETYDLLDEWAQENYGKWLGDRR